MNEFVPIIKGAPLYVWAILVYLLYIGIKSIKTRVIYLPKLFIIPLILLVIKYKTFLSEDALVFCLAVIVGSIASFFINKSDTIRVIKKEGAVEVPGNYRTLLILVSFFIIKYYFGYFKSTYLDLSLNYSVIESIISGLFSGYFIGRALCYMHKYLKVSK